MKNNIFNNLTVESVFSIEKAINQLLSDGWSTDSDVVITLKRVIEHVENSEKYKSNLEF